MTVVSARIVGSCMVVVLPQNRIRRFFAALESNSFCRKTVPASTIGLAVPYGSGMSSLHRREFGYALASSIICIT